MKINKYLQIEIKILIIKMKKILKAIVTVIVHLIINKQEEI